MAVSLTGLLAGGLTGCDSGEPAAEPMPSPTATPLGQVATDTVAVARDGFCERVAPASIEEALAAAPDTSDSWANGERARLASGVSDVAHEYGCSWTAGGMKGGTTARAWVFAPPVTPDQADDLRRAATRTRGCEPLPGAPAFGAHDVALRCSTGDDETVAFHGLFGDAWLSCTIRATGTPGDLPDRAESWCASVLAAAAA